MVCSSMVLKMILLFLFVCVSQCLCVSVARIRERGRGLLLFQRHETPSTGGDYFIFAQLLAVGANFTAFTVSFVSITNPVNTNTECSPKICSCLKNCGAMCEKLSSHLCKCTKCAITAPCYSIINCQWSSSRICFWMALRQSVTACQLLQMNK